MKRFLQFVAEADGASVNVGDTNITADKKANTINMSSKVGDNTTVTANRDMNTGGGSVGVNTKIGDNTTVTANKDMSPGGSSSVGVDTKIGAVDVSARQNTAAYNKGQIGGTSSVSATHRDTAGDKHSVTVDKGVGFGGASKDVQQGRNVISTYRKNDVNVATKVGGY